MLSHENGLLIRGWFSRYKPDFDELFLKRTVQCKQCGRRFSDDASGKKKLEDHLDMHFRQKRKANQNAGRGHSRSWFTGLDVSFLRVDVPNSKH
jgi:hypothetical protein